MKQTGLIRFCLYLFLLLPFGVTAQTEHTVKTIPNLRLENQLNHVSNPDGILQMDTVARINHILQALEDSMGIEVAVVAVRSIGENDARMFANDLFKHWGLGKKGEDNGLLIQLVTDPPQRSVVFETGYGIEGVLPDAICSRIQKQYMLPDFKTDNYNAGMLKGVAAVTSYLLASDYEREALLKSEEEDTGMIILGIFVFFAPILIPIIIIIIRKNRKRVCPRCNQKKLVLADKKVIRRATSIQGGIIKEIWRCKNCGYTEEKQQTTSRISNNDTGIGGGVGGGIGGFGGFSGGGSSGGSWGGGSSGGGGSISRF
ncbi:MAG: TPM domain-containing protein [Parabacteroides sp.]|nr:TPM domain-containing protein [Parabacteroides sp.]